MNRIISAVALIAAMTCTFQSGIRAQTPATSTSAPAVDNQIPVANPHFELWYSPKFKAGTTVKYQSITIIGEIRSDSVITNTIIETSLEKVILTIKTVATVLGAEQPTEEKLEIPAKIARNKLPENSPGRKLLGKGEEDIRAGEKIYKCFWEEYENSAESGGKKYICRSKTWMSKEVPGGLIRMEASTKDPDGKVTTQIKMILTEYKISE